MAFRFPLLKTVPALAVLVAGVATLPVPALAGGNAVVGTVFGGVIGGVIGSALGHGRDRGVATVGGAALGAVIGNSIGQSADDDDDRSAYYPGYAAPAYYPPPRAYYPPPPVYYAPPPYQAAYAPTPYCRPYRTSIIVDGEIEPYEGTVCLQPDGSWRPVQ